jgi:hypothetical protein
MRCVLPTLAAILFCQLAMAKMERIFSGDRRFLCIVCDTGEKHTLSISENLMSLPKPPKSPFYGTWIDYFSSALTIHADSSFEYSWSFNLNGSWTSGKWEREKDTFFFRKISLNYNSQNSYPVPDRLCLYKNKLYRIDMDGHLMEEKISSPYAVKTSRRFKTFYFREKSRNRNYFDSSYYQKATERRFRMGFGINWMLEPLAGYRVVGSFGFSLSPRYIFGPTHYSYWSIGIPLTTGFSRLDDSASVDLVLGPMIDLPLILNFNHELGGLAIGGSRFGYFAGGGIGYHYNHFTAANDKGTITEQINGFGPVINGGIRFSLKKYRIQQLECKLSYMKIMVASKPDIIGIGFVMNF